MRGYTKTTISGLGPIWMPDHRAQRTQRGWWEAARLHSMRTMLNEHDLLLDVGAEEGDLSALFASWGLGIYLVEPNPKAWPWIASMFECNELTQRVHGWYVGLLGDWEAECNREVSVKGHLGDLGWPECADEEGVPDHGFFHLAEHLPVSPVMTLDQLVAATKFEPTAITMDVEGGELRVMSGAVATLTCLRPKVWISVHDQFMRDMYDQTAEDLHGFMGAFDYDPVYLAHDHEEHWMYLPREYGWRY